MNSVVREGVLYGLLVYAAGFVLGTLRVFVLAPVLGEETALLVELPVMLVIAFILAARPRHALAPPPPFENWFNPPGVGRLLLAGLTGFVTLILLEFAVNLLMSGVWPQDTLSAMTTWPGSAGLFAQFLCVFLPAIRLRG